MRASRNVVTAFVLSMSALALHASTRDGLVFDLGFLSPKTDGSTVTTSEIVDLSKWNDETARKVVTAANFTSFSATRNEGSEGFKADIDGTGVKQIACRLEPANMTVTNVTSASATRLWVTNTETCLYFPQQTNYCGNGVTVIYANAFKTKAPVSTGENATYYCRFKWDGGLGLGDTHRLFCNYDDAAKKMMFEVSMIRGYLNLVVGGKSKTFDNPVPVGKWVDLVIACEANGQGGTEANAYMTYLPTGADLPRTITMHYAFAASVAMPSATTGYLSVAHDNAFWDNQGYYKFRWNNYISTASIAFGFRGTIARLQVYDRVFSKAEAMSLVEGCYGTVFSAGSVNGSNGEFAAVGDSGIAAVYEPLSMAPRQMCGEISIDNPSITVKVPIAECEADITRIISLVPGAVVGTGSCLELVVNNEVLCAAMVEAGKACNFYIGKKDMKRDAEGDLTFTIRMRKGSGTCVGIDALAMMGSWRVNGSELVDPVQLSGYSDTMTLLGAHSAYGGVDSVFWKVLYGQAYGMTSYYYPYNIIGFDVPAAVSDFEKSSLDITLGTVLYPDHSKLDVYLNGSLFKSFVPPMVSGSKLTIGFDPGDLTAGYNSLMVSNASNTYVEGATRGTYNWIGFAGYDYTIVNHGRRSGLVMVVR